MMTATVRATRNNRTGLVRRRRGGAGAGAGGDEGEGGEAGGPASCAVMPAILTDNGRARGQFLPTATAACRPPACAPVASVSHVIRRQDRARRQRAARLKSGATLSFDAVPRDLAR